MKKGVWLVVLGLILMSSAPRPVHIFMAGDSTMADKVLKKTGTDAQTGEKFEETFLERGWGQLLPSFFNDKALVVNMAKNGRSTKTFIEEGLWTDLIAQVRKGDYVVLQFAHNDSSVEKGERYTNPAQFRLNFIAFVDEVRSRGGIPVLCTPVARRKFNEQGELVPTHGVYPDIIRKVAQEKKTLFVDLSKMTEDWLQKGGVEATKQFFHKFQPGESRLYPNGLDDNTHFVESSARIVAGFFVEEMKNMRKSKFNKLLK